MLEAEGQAGSAAGWRALYQRQAGLTDNEADTLKSVGASCQGQEQTEFTKAQPLIDKLRGLLYSPRMLPSCPATARRRSSRCAINCTSFTRNTPRSCRAV